MAGDSNMSKDKLSLKSIYHFLFKGDYPIHSTGIINKKNHTGITLTKFWLDNILVDFKSQKTGRQIWRVDGSRNRYISDVCNRSDRFHNYREYAAEILNMADVDTLIRQVRQYMVFLQERQFDYDAFSRKLPAYLDYISENDENFTKKAREYFKESLNEKEEFDYSDNEGRAYCVAWFLTMFMFHALGGNGEGESSLEQLRENKVFTLKNLSKYVFGYEHEQKSKLVYLTGKNTEICSTPLETKHFFGREKEVFELREMLEKGGKYLISGMGGIGKTELIRQFRSICEEELLADYICTIQYERSMAESVVRAFPNLMGDTQEEKVKEAFSRIRALEQEKVLILIDNMDQGLEADETIQELMNLPASIFITSRRQMLAGFTTYEIKPLDKKAGTLVFRDNYRKPLSKEDSVLLDNILKSAIWRHTLTLRLLGNAARNSSRSIGELAQMLEQKSVSVHLEGQAAYDDLRDVYQRMYDTSEIKDHIGELLLIFSLLPYQSYSLEFVNRYLSGFVKEKEQLEETLNILWEHGWLEKHESGYSMHPFMAECVRPKKVTEDTIFPLYSIIMTEWTDKTSGAKIAYEDWTFQFSKWQEVNPLLISATLTLLTIAEFITGEVSEDFVEAVIMAGRIKSNFYGIAQGQYEIWEKLCKGCNTLSQKGKTQIDVMLCLGGSKNLEELYQHYQEIKNLTEVPQDIRQSFAINLATQCYHVGKAVWAKELAEETWNSGTAAEAQLAAANVLAAASVQMGDFVASQAWINRGLELAKNNDLMETFGTQQLLCSACAIYLGIQDFSKAKEMLQELERVTALSDSIPVKSQLYLYKGSYVMWHGDAGGGIEELKKAKALSRICVGENSEVYATVIVELAMAYNRMKMREEASAEYHLALDIFRQMPEREYDRMRLLNNMSVMYIDWEKPKEALDCLKEALPLAEKMGGLGLAEVHNNFSRAYRQKGNRSKELQYLKLALPVMEANYGAEHPKVVDGRKRLEK